MRKLTLSNLAFWSLAVVCAAMLVAMLLIVGGAIPIDSPPEPTGTESQAAPAPTPTRSTAALPMSSEPAATEPATAAVKQKLAQVVVTAARGDSWISVRVGSESGRLREGLGGRQRVGRPDGTGI